ncbi:MAG: DHH family phosphoesterase [Erysipelotrichaceae bacterium]|nr:DHH family phosphoesterase [Erysipelotrichaceae bacterium]
MNYRRKELSQYPELQKRYQIGSLLAKVLESFQYDDKETASFLRGPQAPSFDHPLLEKLKETILRIRDENRKVFVFGDYDCDGICSTTIMMKILNNLGITAGFYIPNRLTEGYGLNMERLMQAKEKGYDVLITVDNGVSALEELRYAREAGMLTVVIDHHQYEGEVDCDLLIHPLLLDEEDHYLCATGLTYLAAGKLGMIDDSIRVLSALATVADVMELKGINPYLVQDGLKVINSHSWLNVDKLLFAIPTPLNEEDIGFRITPLINAAGRMPDLLNPIAMVRYFLTDDIRAISEFAVRCQQINQKRKTLTQEHFEMLRNQVDPREQFMVLANDRLHEGLTGIIAGKLCDQYKRPVIVFAEKDGLLKGSGRCTAADDIMSALEGFKERFIHYGGHRQACGITMRREDLDDFRAYLNATFTLSSEEIRKEYILLEKGDLSERNLKELFAFRPYGQGRKLPLFALEREEFADYRMLRNDHQLKWSFPIDQGMFSVLSFGESNEGYMTYVGRKLLVIGQLQENHFRSQTSYQLLADAITILD